MTLAPTTFDPYNKSGNFTLSGGNLVATITSGSGPVFATRLAGGPVYFEVNTSNAYSGSPRVGFGVGNTYISSSSNLGTDNYGLGYDTNGNVYLNNAVLSAIATWSAGANISVALDPKHQTVWFRVNGGNWNNSGTANPATNTGGISLATMPGASYYPAVGAAASASFTAAFLSGSWTYSAPSGFSAMSSVTPAGATANAKEGFGSTYSVASRSQHNINDMKKSRGMIFTPGNVGSPLPAGVSISGTIKEGTTAVAKVVRLYDGLTGALLETTTSDGSTGAFSLLGHSRANVFAVAFDPNTYQAIVFDRLTPA